MNKMIYVPQVAYDTKFEMPNITGGFTIVDQLYKDGSKKDAKGKLVVVTDPTPETPNLRIFCTLRVDGMRDNFMQELSKMNGCGFDKVIDADDAAKGIITVKTGAKIDCTDGVITYFMG